MNQGEETAETTRSLLGHRVGAAGGRRRSKKEAFSDYSLSSETIGRRKRKRETMRGDPRSPVCSQNERKKVGRVPDFEVETTKPA